MTHSDPRPLPLPYGYWVPGADLLAGEYPGTLKGDRGWEEKLRRLQDAGVTSFYDLTMPGELEPYEDKLASVWGEDGCAYRRFPIRDVSVPRDPQLMCDLLDRLEVDPAVGHRVYLHCWGGVGRTGTVVGCFLVRRGRTGEEALEEVRRLFAATTKAPGRRAPETDEQERFVLGWSEHDPRAARTSGRVTSPLPASPDRVRGALLGLAVGDALGTTLEFKAPGTFEPLGDMVGGGTFGLDAGQWTDDTSMALCLAESLVETGRFDAADQMRRYVRWYREGYLSSTGTCFDIGGTTAAALHRFESTGEPFSGSTDPQSAGNGSLMRLAPVVLFFRDDPAEAVRLAGESSRTTHGAKTAVDACRYFAALLLGAVRGVPKDELLSWGWAAPLPFWRDDPLHPEVVAVAKGSYRGKAAHDIVASGYVIRTLEAALWAFHRAVDFRSGALAAVNLGRDADTTGAVYGQIAGAWFGEEGIPEVWRAKLAMLEKVAELAEGLVAAVRRTDRA
ncbi:MAG TPA: ADP-ribosylglycohydrolase family protein [Longimicrobiales bacterium]|nr:ADP-ribosylglycohydrolase family protein [Longimicrobiales bacterium]